MVSYRIASRHSRGRELLGEKFEKVLKKQNGKCAICKKKMNPPHADHDHKTDKFRALLCRRCNLGIAYFNDNPRLARAAAKYLELHAD